MMCVNKKDGKGVVLCTFGMTMLLCDIRCVDDRHAMLKKHGDGMDPGVADMKKPAKEGTVEAWFSSVKIPG